MFGVSNSILIVFAFVFSLGILTLDFSVFEKLKRRCADLIAQRFGLYDVYYNVCTTQSLEMIRSLRHYENDYCDSLVDFVTETLSLPEMLLILGVSHVKRVLNFKDIAPSLNAQAEMIVDFYIDVAKLRLWHPSPPTGLHAHRLCSRWRRRKT